MFKPIAFCLSTTEIDDHKFYTQQVKLYSQVVGKYNLHLWYIGIIPTNANKFMFSFPQTDNLLDRNIVISLKNNEILIENDWLGSIPIFYNSKDLIISTIPGLCLRDRSFDMNGIENYFNYGYSVFEHTPFKDVKFLRYFSIISVSSSGMHVTYKADPILKEGLFEGESTEQEAIGTIASYIQKVENTIPGKIIIPTSGGYDSRILNISIGDKSRICSYTYGLSRNQTESYEVVYAKKISEILGTKWEQIKLNSFNTYIDEWHRQYGFSTHLHGMYQIEFYDKILRTLGEEKQLTLLSGIFGDVWSGNISQKRIDSVQDLIKLGYTHGLSLGRGYSLIDKPDSISTNYFEEHRKHLSSYNYQIVATIRIKIILISYLMSVPEYYGVPAWTPFLDFNVATTILRLPSQSKLNRSWQRKLFQTVGLDVENMKLKAAKSNSLDYEISKGHYFNPIDERIFENILDQGKLNQLNIKLNKFNRISDLIERILAKYRIYGLWVSNVVHQLFRRLGIKAGSYVTHLGNYYIIKAVEKSCLRR